VGGTSESGRYIATRPFVLPTRCGRKGWVRRAMRAWMRNTLRQGIADGPLGAPTSALRTLMQMQQLPALLDPADTDPRTSESVFSLFLVNRWWRYHQDVA
jgi:hypothetical protein